MRGTRCHLVPGESNAHEAALYRNLMETLIREWQGRFTARDFAFLQVLLAGYPGKGTAWAEIRQAQVEAAGATGTGFASATDRGHTCIHPPQKKDVGERLALRALTDVYGFTDVVSRGPEVASVRMSGEEIEVAFRHADGLRANGTAPLGFEVADKEKKFATAEARLENGRVLLKVPDSLKHPARYVRYAWENYPEKANVYNGAGLPAIPFMRMIGGTILAATAKPVSEDPQHWWNKARAYRHNQKLNNLDAELVLSATPSPTTGRRRAGGVTRHFSARMAAFHAIQLATRATRRATCSGAYARRAGRSAAEEHRAADRHEQLRAPANEARMSSSASRRSLTSCAVPAAGVSSCCRSSRGKQENAAWRGGRDEQVPLRFAMVQVVRSTSPSCWMPTEGRSPLHDFLHPSPYYALWADELIRFLRGR